ncbi:MAG: hypothetical protein R3E48_01415 [Burkholderiaceae bacterium]
MADVFDALSSKRPYKDPLPFDQVMAILRRDCGTHFDPDVMAAFERIAQEVSDRLVDGSEQGARRLLEGVIRDHFAIQ